MCYWLEARDNVKHPKMHRQSLHNREVSAPHVSQAKVEESCSGRCSSALSEFKSRTGYRKETGKYNKACCDGKSVSHRICTQVGAFIQSLAASKSFKKHSDQFPERAITWNSSVQQETILDLTSLNISELDGCLKEGRRLKFVGNSTLGMEFLIPCRTQNSECLESLGEEAGNRTNVIGKKHRAVQAA